MSSVWFDQFLNYYVRLTPFFNLVSWRWKVRASFFPAKVCNIVIFFHYYFTLLLYIHLFRYISLCQIWRKRRSWHVVIRNMQISQINWYFCCVTFTFCWIILLVSHNTTDIKLKNAILRDIHSEYYNIL